MSYIWQCAEDDFQKKWKLTGLSGNKLSKMKYSEFMKIWEVRDTCFRSVCQCQ